MSNNQDNNWTRGVVGREETSRARWSLASDIRESGARRTDALLRRACREFARAAGGHRPQHWMRGADRLLRNTHGKRLVQHTGEIHRKFPTRCHDGHVVFLLGRRGRFDDSNQWRPPAIRLYGELVLLHGIVRLLHYQRAGLELRWRCATGGSLDQFGERSVERKRRRHGRYGRWHLHVRCARRGQHDADKLRAEAVHAGRHK